MCRVRAKILVARKLGRERKRERSGEGVGWGSEGTLASKPHDSEKPVRPRTGLLIGAARSC